VALARASLVALGLLVAWLSGQRSYNQVAWPDECIYLVGARNLVERGSLDTNFYLTHSLLARGHPHRDVHMPGYVLALAPFVKAFGATLFAASALNLALFLACLLLLHEVALDLLADPGLALLAATLFAVLPPFPGYLFVAYPELLVGFAFLLALLLLLRAKGLRGAFLAGAAFGLGALARETLLVTFPLAWARLPRRELWRGFVPGALSSLLVLVAPLARDRAIHPNALYPSVFEEARRSSEPLGLLLDRLLRNAAQNLADVAAARPLENAEDAVLLLLLGLAGGAVFALPRLLPETRRLALAMLVSLGLLSVAVLFLYVVRARGGVWGGVRAYMCFAPLLLVFVVGALRGLRPLPRGALALAFAALLLLLDSRQLYRFLRYKSSDHEDQTRHAGYVAGYVAREHPQRILGRLFLYGFLHYPTEIIWSPPRDYPELRALEARLMFDYVVINDRSPLRLHLIRNPRYVRVNKDDKGAELLIFRRLE
jgi:hypothetical protein